MKRFSDYFGKPVQALAGDTKSLLKGRFKIQETQQDKMLAFGWASVSAAESGEQIEDWQEDIIDPEVLEQAAYQFVELYREGGEMHQKGGAAVLVESMVFTEEKQKRSEERRVGERV